MSRKTMLVSAPLGLGALVMIWAAMATRAEPETKPARPAPKAGSVQRTAPIETTAFVETPRPAASAPASSPVSSGGEYSVIEGRIRLLEEKLLALETKKAELVASNQGLERQVAEKQVEHSARSMAEWRVRQWEQLLGLSETQKQSILDLCTKWAREDGGKPAARETWLQREVDLRARLSAEQAAKLTESTSAQSRQMWSHMGRSIGGMVGAPKEEHARLQQTLGDWRSPASMLLPEAHGADWPGQMKEASARLQPVLSPDQLAKLGRYMK